eukprot:GDKI01000008.1.p1 GENE.GDKI01000008.1~~GDKI01000008.1.p1  ORF type:complete len:120 (-),score=21.73 GDKI01000008.1:105-434(-)
MLIATTDAVPGYTVLDCHGLVEGCTVRTRNVVRDVHMQLKSYVGGELEHYTDLQTQARLEAVTRMTDKAKQLGANAILGVKYASTNMGGTPAVEYVVYGTAFTLKKVGK